MKEIAISIRNNIPDTVPLFCRISAVDGQKNGWELNDSISLSKILAEVGIDVIDCSSGGIAGRPGLLQMMMAVHLKVILIGDLGFKFLTLMK